MKTKKEIIAQIAKLRTSLHKYDYLPKSYRKNYEFIVQGQIIALRWALGYKMTTRYFCATCQLPHKNLKCPKCGNETEVKPNAYFY